DQGTAARHWISLAAWQDLHRPSRLDGGLPTLADDSAVCPSRPTDRAAGRAWCRDRRAGGEHPCRLSERASSTRKVRRAVQSEPGSPPPYSATAISGD